MVSIFKLPKVYAKRLPPTEQNLWINHKRVTVKLGNVRKPYQYPEHHTWDLLISAKYILSQISGLYTKWRGALSIWTSK